MTHGEFLALIGEYGFERAYFLPPDKYEIVPNPHRLVEDVSASFPFARCVAALVYPYAPFDLRERIPAYYLASNKAYHARKALLNRLNELGIRAEKADIPIRTALSRAGIGTVLKTGFISIAPFGTRIVLESIALDGLDPVEYGGDGTPECTDCGACIAACPAGAIGENGVDYSVCFRSQMESAAHPDHIRDAQMTYIGCEICQYCCPMNAGLQRSEPSEAVRRAFDTGRLILGDAKDARALVGKNMSSNGKLTAEAIVFASRDGEYAEEILASKASPFEAVRDAVRYHLEQTSNENGKKDET